MVSLFEHQRRHSFDIDSPCSFRGDSESVLSCVPLARSEQTVQDPDMTRWLCRSTNGSYRGYTGRTSVQYVRKLRSPREV